MNVLIACEASGVARDAFTRKGHYALSCDSRPSDTVGPHYVGDVLELLCEEWDLMVAHPPCTYICSSGIHWTNNGYRPLALTEEALSFFLALLEAPIPHIGIENPVGIVSTTMRPPDQYIQPYNFGEDASKKTGLWLKNLPRLQPTKGIKPRWVKGLPRWANQTDKGDNAIGPNKSRSAMRSQTYPGIAAAMADQWGAFVRPVTDILKEN